MDRDDARRGYGVTMSNASDTSRQSGTRARTRQAILDAAVSVLARDQAAPLAEVAKAAGVSRTTLHRHFADRAELLSAAIAEANAVIAAAVSNADTAQGDAREALRRLVAGLIEAGDHIVFLFYSYASTDDDQDDAERGDADDQAVIDLIRRGQSEGVITGDLDAKWIENALWSLIFAGCEDTRSGGLPRHIVIANVIRTLEGGIAP
jgi:AcrR family transcriptional regulator